MWGGGGWGDTGGGGVGFCGGGGGGGGGRCGMPGRNQRSHFSRVLCCCDYLAWFSVVFRVIVVGAD